MESGSAAVEKLDSHNLRDFLRIREEDRQSIINHRIAANGGVNIPGITLGAVLGDRIRPVRPADVPIPRVRPNRTLLDIIRDDQSPQRRDRNSWLQLKEKLRLRCSSSTVPIPINNQMIQRNSSNSIADSTESTQLNISSSSSLQMNPNPAIDRTNGGFEHTASLEMRRLRRENIGNYEAEEQHPRGAAAVGEVEEQPARMSLMALLEETDRHMGLDGSMYTVEDEEEVAESHGDCGGGEHNSCCVCMVRLKGAAFIPCGHTFCRLCCRELLAQRGNCPLCNNRILEILDIF